MDEQQSPLPTAAPVLSSEDKLRQILTIGYGLQAAAFLFGGLTSIIAVVLAYVKQDDARGTWLESHFRWQIRTFWFGLLWAVIGGITMFVAIGFAVLLADAVWVIYRMIKGWLNLSENKPMYF